RRGLPGRTPVFPRVGSGTPGPNDCSGARRTGACGRFAGIRSRVYGGADSGAVAALLAEVVGWEKLTCSCGPMSDPAASLERAHPLHDSPPLALSIAITPLALIGMFGTPALAVYTGAGYDLKPYPWIMAMQIGLPWVGVALAWCCPRWFSIFHGRGRYARRSSDTCSLQFEFFFPTVFVYLIHYRFAVLPARQGLLPWACLFGAILLVGGGLRDPYLWGGGARMHKGTLLFAALLSLF